MLKALIFFIFLFISFLSFGQKEANIWYFGERVGFDFNDNTPQPIFNSQMASEARSAVISDKNTGDLLFYSDGATVWNRNHEVMSNGTSLNGKNVEQGVFILPVPNRENVYYLFTVSGDLENQLNAHLYYSVIDMSLDNGLGGIQPTEKNIFLASNMTNKITAVQHDNGKDYWLLTHKLNSTKFYVFNVTGSGISDPDIYAVGSVHNLLRFEGYDRYERNGYLKASPDGKMLACAILRTDAQRPFEIFDFDAATGKISNPLNLGDFSAQYGVSFSPDNSKLYVSGVFVDGIEVYGYLHQFDLNAGDIPSSRVSLMNDNPSFDRSRIYNTSALALQVGPDGKIYGTGNPLSLEEIKKIEEGAIINNMFVIENPNGKGFNCGLKIVNFDFPNGRSIGVGLPQFIESNFNYITPSENFNSPCLGSKDVLVFPNPTTSTIQISIAERCFEPYNLIIYNVLGKVLRKLRINNALSQKIEVGSFAAGVYILSMQLPDQKLTKKFIRQ